LCLAFHSTQRAWILVLRLVEDPGIESDLPTSIVRFAGLPCGAGTSRVCIRGAGVRDSPYRRQPRALV